jgi:hypothetical protein
MTAYVNYDSTGVITQVGMVPDFLFAFMPTPPAGLSRAALSSIPPDFNAYQAAHWVNSGTVTAKGVIGAAIDTTTIAADGTAAATITGLPMPCTVTVSGALSAGPLTVTDGTVVLTCDHPGDLILNVTAEPAWLPYTVTVHAS